MCIGFFCSQKGRFVWKLWLCHPRHQSNSPSAALHSWTVLYRSPYQTPTGKAIVNSINEITRSFRLRPSSADDEPLQDHRLRSSKQRLKGWVTVFWICTQAFADDLPQPSWHIRVSLWNAYFLSNHLSLQLLHRFRYKRSLSIQGLVQHNTEAELVSALIRLESKVLFRSHVQRRSQHTAYMRQR